MAIVITGTKTVTNTVAPHLPAATLTSLLATAPENWTLKQLRSIEDACARVACGNDNATIGTLLT